MKKVLVLMLFVSLKLVGQTPKMEVVVGTTENSDGIKAVLKNTNPTTFSSAISGSNLSTNSSGRGVSGFHSGAGIGVFGSSSSGQGVYGSSSSGTGIFGFSTSGVACELTSLEGSALHTHGFIQFGGIGAGPNKFLKSSNLDGNAYWTDLLPYSYTGSSDGSLFSVVNNSSGTGVYGSSSTGWGVNGFSQLSGSSGVYGLAYSANSNGVKGYSENGYGNGVYGSAESGIGVKGYALNFFSTTGVGGHFSNALPTGYALITGTGIVGIGRETPSLNSDERVEINGRLRVRDSTSTAGVWFNNSANGIGIDNGAFYGLETAVSGSERAGIWIGSDWRFYINRVGNANFTGTVTATGFPIASDKRYKKNIQPLENTLSKVQKIVGVSYGLRKEEFPEKNFSDQPQIGFIAQDLEKIFPEMVFTDEKGYKSVDYARLTPVLVEALKELTLKNQTLETKNQTLESRLDKIEAMLSNNQPNIEKPNSKK